jgi:hypothetical protein
MSARCLETSRVGHARTMTETSGNEPMHDTAVRILRLDLTSSAQVEMPETPDSVCHIAGFPVRVGNTIRQRCAWCGEILSAAVPDAANAERVQFPSGAHEDLWQVGALVRRRADGVGQIGTVWQDETPPDACY